jgi:tetratricopeptide (TPR) repeat protein
MVDTPPLAPAEPSLNILLQERYQLIRRIGQGGMGQVYEALDTRLGHVVAIKQTLPGPLDDIAPEDDPLRRAFEREARILASLRHPALPVVSDFFTEDNAQYLVMQYIPGEDLWALMQHSEKAFSIDQVLEWADTLLDVLDYLHTHQPPILHRDIKPQNLKLTPRGEIILLDFGLARGATTIQSRMSTGGSLVAYTPQYAPMEQIRGLPIGARSDLYALAATLHHLLTGQLPASAIERAAAALEGRPDPLVPAISLNPEIPQTVNDLIKRAMSPRVEERPANAAAMRAILRRVYRPSRQMITTPAIQSRMAPGDLAPLATYTVPAPAALAEAESTHAPAERLAALWSRLGTLASSLPPWARRREVVFAGVGALTLAIGLSLGMPRGPASPAQASDAPIAELQRPAIQRSAELIPTATLVDPATRSGYQRAIETLSAAISVHPEDVRNYLSRAEAHLALKNFSGALADYDRVIELQPADPAGYLGRATAYAAQHSYALAIDDYTRALAIDTTLANALAGRAQALVAQGDNARAIDDYDRFLELRPSDPAGYLGRGTTYLQARAFRQALADLNQAIALRPNLIEAYIQRGLTHVGLEEYDLALSDYDRAIQIQPDNAEAYLQRGRASFYQRAYERAISDYNHLLELRPGSAVGLYNRGLAYSARGDQAQAVADFTAYLRLHPDDADIYLYRAMAYTRLGQRANAATDLRRCIELSNDPALRAQAERQLKTLGQG